MQLTTLSADDWCSSASRFDDLAFDQTAAYAKAAASRVGGQTAFVQMSDAGQIVAMAAARVRCVPGLGRGIVWIPSGPLLLRRKEGAPQNAASPDPERLEAVLSALRQYFCAELGHILRLRLPGLTWIQPQAIAPAMAAAGFRPTARAWTYQSALMDLSKDESQTKADLHPKWRNGLKLAIKESMSAETGDTPELRDRFLALYAEVQEIKDFRSEIGPEFHFALTDSSYVLEIVIIQKDGVDVAGGVISLPDGVATYLFAATNAKGRDLCAGYFLTWTCINRARQMGARLFDVGGISSIDNPNVARFKERLNGIPFHAIPYEADNGGPIPTVLRTLESLRAKFRQVR